MVEESTCRGTYRLPSELYGFPAHFNQANIFLALASAVALVLNFLQPYASAEEEHFLVATVVIFVISAIAGALVKRS